MLSLFYVGGLKREIGTECVLIKKTDELAVNIVLNRRK